MPPPPPPNPAATPPPPAPAPPAPAPPPTPAAPVATPTDPHALGASIGRLSAGLTGGPRKAAKAPATALAVLLRDGELVECLVVGTLLGEGGIAALTTERLLFVTEREWVPDVMELPVVAGLTVQGMQDERTASLTFQHGPHTVLIERISDRPLAMEMAQRVRTRAG
jgi:hypothetical protein